MNWPAATSGALTAMRQNLARTALTLLGITVGIGAVVILVALGEGAQAFIGKEFSSIGSNLLIIIEGKAEVHGMPMMIDTTHHLTLQDAQALRTRARSLEGLTALSGGTANLEHAARSRSIFLLGVDESFGPVRQIWHGVGRGIQTADVQHRRRVIVIGQTLVTELFAGENPLGAWIEVDDARFQVIGILQKTGVSFGFDMDDLALVPVSTALDHFHQEKLMEVIAKHRADVAPDDARREVAGILTERHAGREDFTIKTQDEIMSSFADIMTMITMLLAGLAGVSLVVGGVGIMNVMLATVSERIAEIGLRKAVGATRGDILAQFLLESTLLGGAGGLIGVALGVSGATFFHVLYPDFPVVVSPTVIVLAMLFSLGTGAFFGTYPAWSAARLSVLDALRQE